jgi:hypothetical protein
LNKKVYKVIFSGSSAKMTQEKGRFELPEGYGDDELVLMIANPEMIYAYWEVGKEQKEKILQRRNNESSLILRLYEESKSLPVTSIRLGNDSFIGSYYLKREHGVEPNKKYRAEIGFSDGNSYSLLVPGANNVTTPRDSISEDTTLEFYDPRKEKVIPCKISKKEEKGIESFLRKTDEQIKKDIKSGSHLPAYYGWEGNIDWNQGSK